jgi:hypothetical protein
MEVRYGQGEIMSGFEDNSTETLLEIQNNLLNGLSTVAKHIEAGTFTVSKKEGAAPPSQSGNLTLIFLLRVEDELENRIRDFKRSIDPQLFKTKPL